jgi:hypothetical protein
MVYFPSGPGAGAALWRVMVAASTKEAMISVENFIFSQGASSPVEIQIS